METVLSQYTHLVSLFAEEQASYAIKPSKASSARLRKYSQQMNNLGPMLRKDLVAADKAA